MHLIALLFGHQTKCKRGFQVPLEIEVEEGQNIHCSQREIDESLSSTLVHPFPKALSCARLDAGE